MKKKNGKYKPTIHDALIYLKEADLIFDLHGYSKSGEIKEGLKYTGITPDAHECEIFWTAGKAGYWVDRATNMPVEPIYFKQLT